MSLLYKTCLISCIISLSQQEETLKINNNLNRIVGGQATTIENAKYLVSLRKKRGDMFCAGSLITRRYVVTAAHCLEGIKRNQIRVHGGVTRLDQTGVARTVERIFKPKVYNPDTIIRDVAVLKLSGPMRGNKIAPIPLCTRDIPPMSWVEVFGWGTVKENAQKLSNQLRVTAVRMVDKETCAKNYESVLNLTDTMMCAHVPGTKDSCQGDSGGPLEYRGQLCGIVSFGVGCARSEYPGIYTSVKVVKPFIIKATKI